MSAKQKNANGKIGLALHRFNNSVLAPRGKHDIKTKGELKHREERRARPVPKFELAPDKATALRVYRYVEQENEKRIRLLKDKLNVEQRKSMISHRLAALKGKTSLDFNKGKAKTKGRER